MSFSQNRPVIRRPDGLLFRGRGVNVRWLTPDGTTQQGSQWITNMSTAEPLTRSFPGINMVRIAAFSAVADIGNAAVADMKPYIDAIVTQGIVVILHCNISGDTLVGTDLTDVTNWYADAAVEYAANPLVWFSSQSGPSSGNPANDAMLSAIYGAVRGAGNEGMFLVTSDVTNASATSGFGIETLAGMHNFVWDHHFYNSASNYSDDQDINNAALADTMGALWKQANVPIIIGEFGDASDGQTIDAGWQQTLQAIYDKSSLSGFLQAWWNTTADSAAFAGNQLLLDPFSGTNLTQGGAMLRNAILSGA